MRDFIGLYFSVIIDDEINNFQSFLSSIKKEVNQESEKLNKEWLKSSKTVEKKYLEDYQDNIICEYDKLNSFEQLLFKSFVICCYSFMENYLSLLIKDGNLFSNIEYIKKTLDIEFIGKDTYDNLQKINKIRNCLVHKNGNISEYKFEKVIKDFSKINNNLISVSDNIINIKFEFLEFIMTINHKILKEINKNIKLLVNISG